MKFPANNRSVTGHGLLILAGAVLIGVAVHAANRGLEQYVTSVLEQRMGDWDEVSATMPLSERHDLIAEVERFALPPSVSQKDVPLVAGQAELDLLRERLRDHPESGLEASETDPLEGFRQALRLRPSWGRGWARFGQVKAMRDEYDDELVFALEFAVQMAPEELDVRALVVSTGFNAWSHLPDSSKELIWSVALEAMESPYMKRHVSRWARSAGLADHLAASLRRQEEDTEGEAFQPDKAARGANAATRYRW